MGLTTLVAKIMATSAASRRVEGMLWWAIRWVACLTLALVVLVVAVYYWQRYSHPSVPLLARDIQAIEADIRQNPGDPQLRVAVANLYFEDGKYDEAIVQAKQVVDAHPAHLGGVVVLARAYEKAGRIDDAISSLSRAVALNRDNPMAKASLQLSLANQLLGRLYLEDGRGDEAIAALDASLDIDRTNADTLRLLGIGLARLRQLDEAIATDRQALRFVPDFPEVYRDLVGLYDEKGDRERGLFARGMVKYSEGDYGGALEYLRGASLALPDMPEAHLGLAMVYEKMLRRDEALAEYQLVLAADSASVVARQGIGRLEKKP